MSDIYALFIFINLCNRKASSNNLFRDKLSYGLLETKWFLLWHIKKTPQYLRGFVDKGKTTRSKMRVGKALSLRIYQYIFKVKYNNTFKFIHKV